MVRLGIVPTPEMAFHAQRQRRPALVVTPSHNPLGYVGLKGFSAAGRLWDREWSAIGEAYRVETRGAPRPRSGRRGSRASPGSVGGHGAPYREEYLDHLAAGLNARRTIVIDTRGGATAARAPEGLARIGARVVSLSDGFSPTFFGRSPEPTPESLGPLRDRIREERAALGFAFDGDGDRCVCLDERGSVLEPEVIALLLYQVFGDRRHPIVASADCSRILERHVRTVRSRVGGRFVTRAMRRAGAEIGVERSGHIFFRRYGSDSDGVLTACLVAHAVDRRGMRMSEIAREVGPIYRGSRTTDYEEAAEARRAYRALVEALGARAKADRDGISVEFDDGWCLIRRSRTQPSIRLSYEASSRAELRHIDRTVRQWIRAAHRP